MLNHIVVMEEEFDDIEELPEGDEGIPEELDESDAGDDDIDDSAEPDGDNDPESNEPEEEEIDDDSFATVEYDKDGETYRYEVPRDVVEAIRVSERERLGSRRETGNEAPQYPKSELADTVVAYIRQGYSDEKVMEAIAQYYNQEMAGRMQAQEEDQLPENATIEEEMEYRVNKAVKPLMQQVEQLRREREQWRQQQAQEMTWEHNNTVFGEEMKSRGLPETMNPRSAAILRRVFNETYPGVDLGQYKLRPQQARFIVDAFVDELTRSEWEEEPYQKPRQEYARARVVYGGRVQQGSRKQPQRQIPQRQQSQTEKKAPQVLSGRTARGSASRISQEPERPKSPQEVVDRLWKL